MLPAIVCSDDFTHFHILARLLGLHGLDVRADPDDCTVAFFTEYGIAESLYGPSTDHFVGLPAGKDTPDVVVLITEPAPVLIALEAKLYDKPQPTDLSGQLARQKDLLSVLTPQLEDKLGRPVHLVHAALLPQAYKLKAAAIDAHVITWEELAEAYRGVAPPYFHAVLTEALRRYPDLVSRPAIGTDPCKTGVEILRRHERGDPAVAWVGRRGGLQGPHLATDIASGAWRTASYRCSPTPGGNQNWFPVAEFAQRVYAHEAGHRDGKR